LLCGGFAQARRIEQARIVSRLLNLLRRNVPIRDLDDQSFRAGVPYGMGFVVAISPAFRRSLARYVTGLWWLAAVTKTSQCQPGATATNLVLTVTQMPRRKGVVVEVFGPCLDELALADRATIGNMATQAGCLMWCPY
jgi:hypothetical protein